MFTFCYIACAAVLTFLRHDPIALVYFAFTFLPVLFADRLIKSDKIRYKTLTAFFLTAVGYQTTFEIFYSVHNDFMQVLSAVGIGLFYTSILMLTDERKLPWCICAVPVLCGLNIKIAIGYCLMLMCVSVMSLKKNTRQSAFGLAVSLSGFIVCAVSALTTGGYFLESSNYLLERFKNPFFLMIIAAYLTVKLLKSKGASIPGLCLCLALTVGASVFATLTLGWAVFSLMCLILTLFIGKMCLESVGTINAIRTDFAKNKLIFITIIICVLQ
ncbi:MAG: hypothetical protein IIU80_03075 [Clostridia bacterium]|nr:hypothetical protein [Clostridia bacterium]